MTGEWTGVFLYAQFRFPATITEYVTPGVPLWGEVSYGAEQHLDLGERTLAGGTTPARTVGAGPLVPSRRAWNDDSERYGNRMSILENMTLGDSADYTTTTSMRLSSGGEVLGTSTNGSLNVAVPATGQTYELVQENKRRGPYAMLSPAISSEWTFRSAPGTALLPLMDLTVATTGLDSRNRAWSTPVTLTVTPSTRGAGTVDTVERIE